MHLSKPAKLPARDRKDSIKWVCSRNSNNVSDGVVVAVVVAVVAVAVAVWWWWW